MVTNNHGIFPDYATGLSPGGAVCNGYTPEHSVVGGGPYYIAPGCATTLTDCMYNALISEIISISDKLGYPFNVHSITNSGDAIADRFRLLELNFADKVSRGGDWMDGPLHQPNAPTEWSELTNKAYVDGRPTGVSEEHLTEVLENLRDILQNQIDNRVRRDGDQMEGALIASRHPQEDFEFATKWYVDQNHGLAHIGDAPPSNPLPGRMWLSRATGGFFIYFDDDDSEQWLEVCSGCGGGGGIEDAPHDGRFYARRDGEWVEINV